ncbi:MAG: hypothetical protein K2M95_06725, partial [Clostridiales bacterium]|nr:hypothetical protein [Clostridiales bacterium]
VWYTECIMRKWAFSIVISLLSAALIVAGLFAVPVYADTITEATEIETRLVRHETDTLYRYFDYPTAVLADENGFTVVDGETALRFAADGTENHGTYAVDRGTQKLRVLGGKTVTLAKGVLKFDAQEVAGTYADFAVTDTVLYAIDAEQNDTIVKFTLTDEILSEEAASVFTFTAPVKKIAAATNGLFFTAESDYNPYCDDLYFLAYGADACTRKLTGIDEALSLESGEDEDVTVLMRSGITVYATQDGIYAPKAMFDCSDILNISTYGNSIFGITRLKGVRCFDTETNTQKNILASAESEIGFYNAPADVTTRKNKIAVADERNGRVQVTDENGTTVLSASFYRPKAVTIDYTGNFYVAHDGGTVTKYTPDYKEAESFSAPAGKVLCDLLAASDDTLYALAADGQLYKITPSAQDEEKFTPVCAGTKFTAIEISQSSDVLLGITAERKVIKIEADETPTTVLIYACDAVDFCTDHDDNLYLLATDGQVVKYVYSGGDYRLDDRTPSGYKEGSEPVGATKIVMNTVTFESPTLAYGDLLLCDTGAHAIKAIDGKLFNVNELLGDDENPPEIEDADTPSEVTDSRIIYAVKSTCEVYAQDAERNIVASVSEGMRVIVPAFDESKKFTFIIADNLTGGSTANPITGYVYTSFLVQPALPYTAEHPDTCYTWTATAVVYKYPTRNSPVLSGYRNIEKNSKFKLLDFAYTQKDDAIHYGYADNYYNTITWYRVAFGENDQYEGYVVSDYISVRGANPDERNVYPRVNAVIISKDKSFDNMPATLYRREMDEDGKVTFVPIDDPDFAPLAVGTRVEVVGAFDTTEKYTQIKYYLEDYGTVTVWVETANLKYDGINKANAVALVLIILTVVLIITLIATLIIVKRLHKSSAPTKL